MSVCVFLTVRPRGPELGMRLSFGMGLVIRGLEVDFESLEVNSLTHYTFR